MHYKYCILGLVAFLCSFDFATLYSIHHESKKDSQPRGTETENKKSGSEKIPKMEILREALLRNPRCPDVSVIYFKNPGWLVAAGSKVNLNLAPSNG